MRWKRNGTRSPNRFGHIAVVAGVMAVWAFPNQALAQEKPSWTLPRLVQHALDNNKGQGGMMGQMNQMIATCNTMMQNH